MQIKDLMGPWVVRCFAALMIVILCSSCQYDGGANKDGGIPGRNLQFGINEFTHWISLNQDILTYKRNQGGMIFTLNYQPPEMMTINAINNSESISTDSLEQYLNHYSQIFQFVFEISTDKPDVDVLRYGIQSIEQYQTRIQQFSFEMEENFFLEIEGNKLECSWCHFERDYSLNNNCRFVVGFTYSPPTQSSGELASIRSKDITFIFDDHHYGQGRIKIRLSKDRMEQIPRLKF